MTRFIHTVLATLALRRLIDDVPGNPELGLARMIQTQGTQTQSLEDAGRARIGAHAAALPISVVIAVRNEEHNLPRCLGALSNFRATH